VYNGMVYARHAPLYRAFRAAEDFLAAACLEAAHLARRRRGPSRRRMAAAWIACHGLIGLMRDSDRWHAWRPRQAERRPTRPTLFADAELSAVIGRFEDAGFIALELLTAAALEREGAEMRHCVGSYWHRCLAGERVFALSAPDGRRATAHFVAEKYTRASSLEVRYALEQLTGPGNAEVEADFTTFCEALEQALNAPERGPARRAAFGFVPRLDPPDGLGEWGQAPMELDEASRRRLLPAMARLGLAPAAPETLLVADVAGWEYHAGPMLEVGGLRLAAGEALVLTPEPSNPHDALAVRIDWQEHPLGYVPRPENADIARALAFGRQLVARVAHHDPEAPARRRLEFIIAAEQT